MAEGKPAAPGKEIGIKGEIERKAADERNRLAREGMPSVSGRLFKSMASLAPNSYVEKIIELMKFSDYEIDARSYVGFSLFFGLILGAGAVLDSYVIFKTQAIISAVLGAFFFFGFQFITYSMIFFSADRKARFAETMLPDVLQLTASNVRAGLTPDKALLLAARPEFGVLEKEIRRAAKEAMTGKNIGDSLISLSSRIRSTLLDRTMKLIAEGVRSGGELAKLLEETAEDIRNGAALRREVNASVMMYIIFIFIAAGFGAPMLFGVSTFLIETMMRMSAVSIPAEATSAIYAKAPFSLSTAKVSMEFLINFAFANIIATGIFSGIILGLIEEGHEKAGIKYVPVLVVVGVLTFLISRALISSTFGFIGQ